MQRPWRVLLVEPDRVAAAALTAALRELGAAVRPISPSRSEWQPAIRGWRPTALLVDAAIGFVTITGMRREFPGLGIVVMLDDASPRLLQQALHAGATAVLVKDAILRLRPALERALPGRTYLSPVLSKVIPVSPQPPLSVLSPRQQQVLRLIARGYSNKQIAPALRLSIKTVDTHRTELMRRLGIHQVAGLVRYAIAAGLVTAAR